MAVGHAERRIVQVMDRVKTRGGRRCVVLYTWEVPDRLDEEHIAHLVFLFEDGGRIPGASGWLAVTRRPACVSGGGAHASVQLRQVRPRSRA